jgi:hypothetical protein
MNSPLTNLPKERVFLKEENALAQQCQKLAQECKALLTLVNEIFNPIDSANRFMNLCLQNSEENSQTREFLLESKEALRSASLVLGKLNQQTQKMEKGLQEIIEKNGQS